MGEGQKLVKCPHANQHWTEQKMLLFDVYLLYKCLSELSLQYIYDVLGNVMLDGQQQ